MEQVQQIVQQHGIVGTHNNTLSSYLMETHRGLLDYTTDFLEHTPWIQDQIQSGQVNLNLSASPISPKAISDLTVTWNSTSSKIQPFLAGLVVYQHPISITLLPKLWNTSPSQTQIILDHLEKSNLLCKRKMK